MEVYKTKNISDEDIRSIDCLDFVSSKNAPNWLYKGSLIEHLKNIPNCIKNFVPLSYYEHKQFKTIDFLGKPTVSLRFKLENTEQVTERVRDALEGVNFSHSFGDLKRYILTVCVELIRNGIIQNLQHNKSEIISLDILETDEDVLIRVTDGFGNLNCEDITSRLKAIAIKGEYERKEYGAGIGIFMVVNSVDSIQFNVESGKKTEVICHMNKYKRLKHFKEKETAIFFGKR